MARAAVKKSLSVSSEAVPPMAPSGAEVRAQRAAMWLIFGSGIFHLVYCAFVGLAGDEAYYWQWSRQLAWGYYDHPPMVAWLIALGTWLAGHNPFGVRLATVLMSFGILWFVYRLTVNFVHRHALPTTGRSAPALAGLWVVAVLVAMPLFSLGGFLATPDIPMVFFWTGSVWLVVHAVDDPRPRTWLLLGVTLALGMLSKYSMVLLPLALIIAFAATRRGRELLRTPGPYLAAAMACLIFLPHLLWLAQHDFVSVSFQLGHGLGGGSRSLAQRLGTFTQFIGTQIGVVSPVLFVFFLVALARGIRLLRRPSAGMREDTRLAIWLLVLPAALTLCVFAMASLFAKPQANWPATAYVTLGVLLGPILVFYVSAEHFKKFAVIAGVTLAALITLYAHLEAVYPIVPFGSSIFDKLQDKKGLAQWLQAQRVARGEEGLNAVVLADNYRQASLLAFYLPDRPYTDAPFERGSGEQYTLWRQHAALPGAYAWYVTRFVSDPRVAELFSDYQSVGVYTERRAGAVVGAAHVYFGHLREERR
jgi:dolichol-phosphate mannosyltransferase